MALSVVLRESFQGVGSLTNGAATSVGTLSGSLVKHAGGPRVTGDSTANSYGYHALISPDLAGTKITNNSAAVFPANPPVSDAVYTYEAWYHVHQVASDAGHYRSLFQANNVGTNQLFIQPGTDAGGNPVGKISVGGVLIYGGTLVYTAALDRWFKLRCAWRQATSGQWDFNVLVRVPGTAWQEVYASVGARGAWSTVDLGMYLWDGGTVSQARWAMPAFRTGPAWSDRFAVVGDEVEPVDTPLSWYVNPATGNDANDGTGPSTAWQTTAKINAESAYGMFARNGGFASGDTLQIDTGGANLLIGSDPLVINTRGLNVVMTGAGELQAWRASPNAGWQLVAGTTRTYSQALTGMTQGTVLWEDDKWLNRPAGTSYAGVQAVLDATPGSFYVPPDGSVMYVHPFGDTNPNTDGKHYTFSVRRGPGGQDGAVSTFQVLAPDVRLSGLKVGKTCLADAFGAGDTATGTAAAIHFNAGAGGNSRLENCLAYYWSKHGIEYTTTDPARNFTAVDCAAEQGSPYVGYGYQSAWVDYTQQVGDGTARSTYLRCRTLRNVGAVGSAAGAVSSAEPVWISHAEGGTPFAQIDMVDCQFYGGPLFQYPGIAQTNLTRGTIPGGNFAAGNVTIADVDDQGQAWTNTGSATLAFVTLPVFIDPWTKEIANLLNRYATDKARASGFVLFQIVEALGPLAVSLGLSPDTILAKPQGEQIAYLQTLLQAHQDRGGADATPALYQAWCMLRQLAECSFR